MTITVKRGRLTRHLILVSERTQHIPMTVAETRAAAAEMIRLADEIEAEDPQK